MGEKLKTTRPIPMGRPKKIKEEDKNSVILRWNLGEDLQSIADAFGCSTSTIRKIVKERME